jgi:peptidoglycan/xylan/chitin deacetylase (PgdA/CDA1 family)
MKRLLYAALWLVGAAAFFRFLHRNTLTIVLYHGVAPRAGDGIFNYRGKFIDPAAFRAQLLYFRRHYVVLNLEEALERLKNGTLPPYALSITFDDGYRNFYQYAYSALREFDLPATMFLATDFVLEKRPLWVDRLEYAIGHEDAPRSERLRKDAQLRELLKSMTDAEREAELVKLEQMSGSPLRDFELGRNVYEPLNVSEIREMMLNRISFGAHTKSHPILSRIPASALEKEIQGSKVLLESVIGTVSSVLAYPNGQPGDWNEAVIQATQDAGFAHALTTVEGANTRDTHPYELRRMVLDGTDAGPAFALIASGVRQSLKSIWK